MMLNAHDRWAMKETHCDKKKKKVRDGGILGMSLHRGQRSRGTWSCINPEDDHFSCLVSQIKDSRDGTERLGQRDIAVLLVTEQHMSLSCSQHGKAMVIYRLNAPSIPAFPLKCLEYMRHAMSYGLQLPFHIEVCHRLPPLPPSTLPFFPLQCTLSSHFCDVKAWAIYSDAYTHTLALSYLSPIPPF